MTELTTDSTCRANRVVDFCISTHSPMVPAILQRWYMSQVGVGGALMLTVEFVLMARGQSYLH